MQLFYTPDISSDYYTFSKEESRHCIKVLRKQTGDKVNLIDGKGGFYTAQIIEQNEKACQLKIIEHLKDFNKTNYYIHIAIAPTKNIDRFEWFLEKATEIGIDEITPLLCDRSERKVIKIERLNKILVSACKQSIKAFLPKLNPITDYNKFVQQTNLQENRFIANCFDSKRTILKNQNLNQKSSLILIGPEGDFTEKELLLAKKNNFTSISLGNSRLRTETAAISACLITNLQNQ